ncbi:hypothetical protein LTR10_000481 [Elasticomyces elasticus]|nr:hypothetical protein LTR10_000481 [Elasticomyces elasticus]KAK4980270.1 hypothetical protein LTR42_000577 [Elasticomyces elasticus]
MASADEVKAPRCRLLELPEELQLEIYKLVVIAKAPIRIVHQYCAGYQQDMDISWKQFLSERKQPALSKTCRGIRNIALPIYYKCNSFRVCCCSDWDERDNASRKWLLSLGESNRALLRDFEVHQGIGYGRYSAAEQEVVLTRSMQGLKLHACTRESTPASRVVTTRRQITFVG